MAGKLDYERLPAQLLFEPLGMGAAVKERDAPGDLIASSFMYASARDWFRLGQLCLTVVPGAGAGFQPKFAVIIRSGRRRERLINAMVPASG